MTPIVADDPCVWVNSHTKFGSDPPRNQIEKLHQLWNELTEKNSVVELPISGY